MFWNQVKKEKEKRKEKRELEKKKREWELAGMFLNEGEKENKRHGCGGEKQEKKKWYIWMKNELKERKNNIKNKKS